jgi:putative sigma-54 modulation protein
VETSKIETTVTFKNLDSSDAVKEYADKRVSKIAKHLHQLTSCDFFFSIEKTSHVAEVHVVSGEFEAKAEARAENMYAAIDELVDKLVQQTRKYKEKLTDHSRKPHHGGVNEVMDLAEDVLEE